jgi:hypothetical protein
MHRPFTEATAPAVATIDDFYAYMPQHKYICVPTREIWVASGVDGRLPKVGDIKATRWLDLNIEQISWAPGETVLIKSRIVSEGGFCEQQGYTCFNGPSSRVVIAAKPDRSTALRDRMMSCRSRINFARELLLPQLRENVKSSRASRYRRQAPTVERLDEWF